MKRFLLCFWMMVGVGFSQVPDCLVGEPNVIVDNNFVHISGTATIPSTGVFQCVTSTEDVGGFDWVGLGGSVASSGFGATFFNVYSSDDKVLDQSVSGDGIVWGGLTSVFAPFAIPYYVIDTSFIGHEWLIFEFKGAVGTKVAVNIVVGQAP